MSAAATYFNGENLEGRPVSVEVGENGRLAIRGENFALDIAAGDAIGPSLLGGTPLFVALSGGGRLEIVEAASAMWKPVCPSGPAVRFIRWLESHARVATTAALLIAAGVAVGLETALPKLAQRAAYLVPVALEDAAGKASLATFNQLVRPSGLDGAEQQMVREQLNRITSARRLHVSPRVVFCSMGIPNAFALPGGTIVVTDELVRTVRSKEEMAAVLAHELGHEELRHGLQSIFRGSWALVVVSAVTGDLSTLTSFSGTLPFLLLQRGYSRDFEREADIYGLALLKDARIGAGSFARILDRLEKSRPERIGPDIGYLSTHPSTTDRLSLIRRSTAYTVSPDSPWPPPAPKRPLPNFGAEKMPRVSMDIKTPIGGVPPAAAGQELSRRTTHGIEIIRQARTDRDLSVAQGILSAAAVQGDRRAMCHLGILQAIGLGGPRNDAGAQHWLKMSAEQGDPAGMYFYAEYLEGHLLTGHPVPGVTQRDIDIWLQLSAKAKFDLAQELQRRRTAGGNARPAPPQPPGLAASGSDHPPRLISIGRCDYPDTLRYLGLESRVMVEFEVTTAGTVETISAISSSFPQFSPFALSIADHLRFEPAVRNGRPISARMRVPVDFTLRTESSVLVGVPECLPTGLGQP